MRNGKWLALLLISATVFVGGCANDVGRLKREGISEFQVGRTEKAAKLLQQALDQSPADSETLYYMGRVAHSQGKFELAAFYYSSAVDADPTNQEARKWLVRAKQDGGYEQPAADR